METELEKLETIDDCRDKLDDLVAEGRATLIEMTSAENSEWAKLNRHHFDLQMQKRAVRKRMEQIIKERMA